MELQVWGARGSYPASGEAFNEFGHHSSCLALAVGEDLVVLDAGTGAAALGATLAREPVRRLHILLSHFHHDHLAGLPFLVLGAGTSAAVAIHTALGSDVPLKTILERAFSAPYFPTKNGELFRNVSFHAHPEGGKFAVGDVSVTSAAQNHPGGSAAFCLKRGQKSLVFATDLEDYAEPPAALVALALGTDLLIHDTMFTREEMAERQGWGHATVEAAIGLAEAAGAKRLAGFHHNPLHDDVLLCARERAMAERLPSAFMLREGQRLVI